MSTFLVLSNPLVSVWSLKLHEMVGVSCGWTWLRFQAAVASCILCSGEVLCWEVGLIPAGRVPPALRR